MLERAIDSNEKIRRAEEIYYRRKNPEFKKEEYATINFTEKKKHTTFKKMTLQIFTCLFIYLVFYTIQNSDYIFSKAILDKTNQILSYDINFDNVKSKSIDYFNRFKNNVLTPVNIEEEKNENTIAQESIETQEEQKENTITEENTIQEETTYKEDASSVSQVQDDASYIKEHYSLIKPLNGNITSRFGTRNPTTESVPKYHTGIDISANVGTKIVAAMDGKVTQVSSSGDYGKHLKIENGDVVTLYAHCNKIYVKNGDEIKQGQEIAEVGQTGNVTGPHLHFEIRKGNEFVDPDAILEFN